MNAIKPTHAKSTKRLAQSQCDGEGGQNLNECAESTADQDYMPDVLEKIHSLHSVLEMDLLACDAKWTLFVAAALSYRYETKLKPFPPRYISEQTGYNIDTLVSVINDTPKLRVILQNIKEKNYEELNAEVIDLLYWVLVVIPHPELRLVDDEDFETFIQVLNEKVYSPRPTHVFEVTQTLPSSNSEENFRNRLGDFSTKFAFYGNKLDCFFSLINQGFGQQESTKCGENFALQLTADLPASLNHSPNGAGWGASLCGSMISCVALCEFINNPEHVQIQQDNDRADILISSNELVRVRYLLFYGSRFPDEDDRKTQVPIAGWFRRHRYSLSLASYVVLLVSIGVANSGSGQYLRSCVWKKARLFWDFCRAMIIPEK